MITVGTHNCEVLAPVNGWFAESGKSNTPSIRLNLRITDGESEGEQIEWHGWLTEKAMPRTLKNLSEIFGWDGDLEALASQVTDGPFAGKRCRIVTELEEYEGKKKIQIKWLNGPGTPGLSVDKALALARRLQGKPATPKAPADDGLAEDTIPF